MDAGRKAVIQWVTGQSEVIVYLLHCFPFKGAYLRLLANNVLYQNLPYLRVGTKRSQGGDKIGKGFGNDSCVHNGDRLLCC
jgi:hypothetical protein